MKANYRGYTIEVERDECMAGFDLIYYTILKGNLLIDESYTDASDTVRNVYNRLKERVDAEIKERKLDEDNTNRGHTPERKRS